MTYAIVTDRNHGLTGCGDPVQSTPQVQGHSECGSLNQSAQGGVAICGYTASHSYRTVHWASVPFYPLKDQGHYVESSLFV